MNIELISPDKLRVNLSTMDLNRYDLDYLSISTESAGTKRMLKDILFEAEETAGFTTRNCKLYIEVLPGKSDGCVLYLTKMPARANRRKRNMTECKTDSYILSCGCIDDAIDAINCFAGYPDIPLSQSSLYNLDGKYMLTFSPVRLGVDDDRLWELLTLLSEYGETTQSSPLKEAILAEHASTLTSGRAVENIMRYFH